MVDQNIVNIVNVGCKNYVNLAVNLVKVRVCCIPRCPILIFLLPLLFFTALFFELHIRTKMSRSDLKSDVEGTEMSHLLKDEKVQYATDPSQDEQKMKVVEKVFQLSQVRPRVYPWQFEPAVNALVRYVGMESPKLLVLYCFIVISSTALVTYAVILGSGG